MIATTKTGTIKSSARAVDELARLDAWRRAANYLAVGQTFDGARVPGKGGALVQASVFWSIRS